MPNNSRPRVVVADDRLIFAETLRDFLSADYEVVRVVADEPALLHSVEELRPDVVVADVSLVLSGGLNAGIRLKKRIPWIKLVCVTRQREPTMAVEAFGASGAVAIHTGNFRETATLSQLVMRDLGALLSGQSRFTHFRRQLVSRYKGSF
jgi:DNA-binding NarL/FixJ family response regulator